jgi:hypothetical protein
MLARLRHEMRAVGLGTFTLPLLVVGIFIGVSLLAVYDVRSTGGSEARAHQDLATGLLFLMEFGIPPVAGIAASNLIANNPALELHLALPKSYVRLMGLRLALFTLWTVCVAALASTLIHASGYWIAPQPAPLNQLAWAAPLLWFTFGGAMLSLLFRSRVASSAILGMLWLGELLFRVFFLQDATLQKAYLFLTLETVRGGFAPDASYWVANRLTLLTMALLFLITLCLLLRRNEALLSHES